MKHMLCVGRVINGVVVVTTPTLEEQLAQQAARNAGLIESNAELLAMHRDLDDIQARGVGAQPVWWDDDDDCGEDFCRNPWRW